MKSVMHFDCAAIKSMIQQVVQATMLRVAIGKVVILHDGDEVLEEKLIACEVVVEIEE